MLILMNTTDTIKVKLDAAIATNQLQCQAHFRETTSTTFLPERQTVVTNNTTAVTVVSAPAASTQRIVDFLSIYNADTALATVTVYLDDNGTLYTLFKGTIAAGETIQYQEGKGFYALAVTTGAIKTQSYESNAPTSSDAVVAVLASDVVNSNAVANTIQDITGLSAAVNAGTLYYFRFFIRYITAAATTGARFTFTAPASPTVVNYWSQYTSSTTAVTTNYVQGYDLPAAANTASVVAGNIAVVEGFLSVPTSGTLQARFASEVASSAVTAQAGSFLTLKAIV